MGDQLNVFIGFNCIDIEYKLRFEICHIKITLGKASFLVATKLESKLHAISVIPIKGFGLSVDGLIKLSLTGLFSIKLY